MFNPNGYLYVRPTYSNWRYENKGRIKITLQNKKILYLYFDNEKHMQFTENPENAASFSSKPRNYDRYVEYIKRKYPDSEVNIEWDVVVKKNY